MIISHTQTKSQQTQKDARSRRGMLLISEFRIAIPESCCPSIARRRHEQGIGFKQLERVAATATTLRFPKQATLQLH